MHSTTRLAAAMVAACFAACSGAPSDEETDAGPTPDSGLNRDAGLASDAGARVDAGVPIADAGVSGDAGVGLDAGSANDAGVTASSDAGTPMDSGASIDAGTAVDAGSVFDAGADAGSVDSGAVDAGPHDAGLAALNDEFDSVSTTARWADLYPAKHATLDIDVSLDGSLTMVPVAQNFTGWYSEYEGPLFYKNVTGNFVVETSLTLGTATDRNTTPVLANSFCQGGFVIRDPSSVAFNQRWIMYNFGYQDTAVAREIKTTIPSVSGTTDSLSTLNLNNVAGAANRGALRVCRLGSVFRFFHRHPGEATWVEEVFRSTGSAPTRVMGNGPQPARADNSVLSFDRPDLAATVQVGLYVGNYTPPASGVRGEFEYVRFGEVNSVADCLRDL